MKKNISLLIVLFSLSLFAQDKIHIHTVTPDNLVPGNPNSTYIDHPDLNGNFSAKIVVKQSYSPNDVLNDHPINLFYFNNQWTINNSDFAPLPIGASFNVFIGGSSTSIIYHQATGANSTSFATSIDDPLFNNQNPGPNAAFSHEYLPNAGVIAKPLGFDYTNGKRRIYAEDLDGFTTDTNFIIVVPSGNDSFTHESTPQNIEGPYTTIDHPLLNDNPNVSFVFEHYYGLEGNLNDFDHNLGLSYVPSLGRWLIFAQDLADFIPGLAFSILTAPIDGTLSIDENNLASKIIMHPNPVNNMTNISATEEIKNVSVLNMLGQEVLMLKGNSNTMQVNMEDLSAGTYFVKVQTHKGFQILKALKN
tara:strand:+ start:31847 stop:32932 length:1086 start_codon:yes stop_codon:yes gene_type:complete